MQKITLPCRAKSQISASALASACLHLSNVRGSTLARRIVDVIPSNVTSVGRTTTSSRLQNLYSELSNRIFVGTRLQPPSDSLDASRAISNDYAKLAGCSPLASESLLGGPTRTRTWNQGIRSTRRFPPGADYLFTPGFRRSGAGRSSLSSRALQPPGSLCTFQRCTAGLAQGCHRPATSRRR